MQYKKRILISIIVLLTCVQGVWAASANLTNDPFAPPFSTEQGYQSVLFQDHIPFEESFSWVAGMNSDAYYGTQYLCSNNKTEKCAKTSKFTWNSIMGPCSKSVVLDCIDNITLTDKKGRSFGAKFVEYSSPNHPNLWNQSNLHGIPVGHSISIWQIQGATEPGSDLLAVDIGQGDLTPHGVDIVDPIDISAGTHDQRFWAYIAPIELPLTNVQNCLVPLHRYLASNDCLPDSVSRPANNYSDDSSGGSISCYQNQSIANGQLCFAHTEAGQCLVTKSFESGLNIQIGVKSTREPNGWLHGRLGAPDLNITQIPGGSLLKVGGSPVPVPTVYFGAHWGDLPSNIQNSYGYCGEYNIFGLICSHGDSSYTPGTGDPFFRNNRSIPTPWSEDSINALNMWLPLTNNQATSTPLVWSIRTLAKWEMESYSGCFNQGDGLKGLVATNATTYSQGPPSFADGTLNYRVGAPHFNSDGSVFKGLYSLSIRNDVARCLYGFSSAPVKASIQVMTSEGGNSIATTVVGQKNNYLQVRAENFTFSSPTIKIKLYQDGKKIEHISSGIKTKSTIKCVNGTITRKITAIKPTCPAGYNKK